LLAMDEGPVEETSMTELAQDSVKGEPARNPFRLQTLVALVVCCAALYWAVQTTRHGMRPANGWARQLRSGDVNDRQIAAQQLGDCVPEDIEIAVPALVAAMQDEEEPVRASVAAGLGNAGITAMRTEGGQSEARESAQLLTRALADSAAGVRTSAAYALGEFVAMSRDRDFPVDLTSVTSAMVGLLTDPSHSVRSTAETALTRAAGKASFEPPPALVAGLNSWPLKESRRAAAVVLGSFKVSPVPTVTALTRALGDKEPEVRSDAAVALGKLGLDAIPALPTLTANLVDPFVPPPRSNRMPVSSILTSMGPRGVGGGGATNRPTDPAVQAAWALGRIVQPQVEQGSVLSVNVLDALIKALHADREALRNAAEEALRRIGKGASSAIPGLIRDLTESIPRAEAGIGTNAAVLLGDLAPGTERASEAIAALTSAVDAEDLRMRIAAVNGLARFGPLASSALPRLRELVKDEGADAALKAAVQSATDQIEAKTPPTSPRRKGQGRRAQDAMAPVQP
jgi:HEAT repeat protein